jgi:hypothetical protein
MSAQKRERGAAGGAGNLHALVGDMTRQQQVVPGLHHPSKAHEQATAQTGERNNESR